MQKQIIINWMKYLSVNTSHQISPCKQGLSSTHTESWHHFFLSYYSFRRGETGGHINVKGWTLTKSLSNSGVSSQLLRHLAWNTQENNNAKHLQEHKLDYWRQKMAASRSGRADRLDRPWRAVWLVGLCGQSSKKSAGLTSGHDQSRTTVSKCSKC